MAEYKRQIKKMHQDLERLRILEENRQKLENEYMERIERQGNEIDKKIREAHLVQQCNWEIEMLQRAIEEDYEFDKNMNWDGGEGWGEEEKGILHFADPDQIDRRILETPVKKIKQEVVFRAKMLPFADGAMRLAYMMLIDGEQYVLKTFKDPRFAVEIAHSMQNMDTTVTCSFITQEFLKEAKPKKTMSFVDVQVIELIERGFGDTKIFGCVERFIPGDYIKFNSNQGYVRKDMGLTAQTLSHFSWVYSGKQLLMVDLQGINDRSYTLTDPAIHSTNRNRFGATNQGEEGFVKFFRTHACNSVCLDLGLEKHPSQELPDDLRETSLVAIH
eukprot:TRINITY_DN2663_c0_g3_i1.p1 TRINITY_DN2663_c0_g3~~TRINITY_DN2663_c0_g3_i1.p1  ORF type:complete len:331 (+),score=89.92 TRINITY_DN2663_c0_g3_i1:675-1667(+)